MRGFNVVKKREDYLKVNPTAIGMQIVFFMRLKFGKYLFWVEGRVFILSG